METLQKLDDKNFIDVNQVMELADKKYAQKKRDKYPFTAPEFLPNGIISDQVKALAEAICEVLNKKEDNHV